jgi:hypothetical protein
MRPFVLVRKYSETSVSPDPVHSTRLDDLSGTKVCLLFAPAWQAASAHIDAVFTLTGSGFVSTSNCRSRFLAECNTLSWREKASLARDLGESSQYLCRSEPRVHRELSIRVADHSECLFSWYVGQRSARVVLKRLLF